ncbi:MAG: SusC/RagA family TonB-linked outer membrane protein [Saprospiraceae bacterium]|nr:SusC/RagA family TonB-linked outer membrane protein [Saprospiraceae bacterium]
MKKLSLVLGLVLFALGATWAQRTISGTVTDSKGETLIGASILVKGTVTGTVTDFDGKYSITVPAGSNTLVVSYTGFATREVALGASNTLDITLEDAAEQLSEVVVTSLGIKKDKRALGYGVTTITEELVSRRPEADVSRILQGKIPGVNITSTSGVSGTGTNIIIRGYSSITGSNQPLFVVDGVPFNSATNNQASFAAGGVTASSRMLDLDPNNIESVSVLKGLSATVLYGDQGRNGVILVTTKSGGTAKKGAEVSLTQSYFQNRIASLPKYQNNYGGGFQQLTPESWFFSNWGADFGVVTEVPHPIGLSSLASIRNAFPEFAIDPTQPWGPATQAQRDNIVRYPNRAYDDIGTSFFRTGQVHNTSLQISGGAGNSSYNVSFGYQDEEGFTPGNNLRKINFGLGLSTAISEKLSVRSSFAYISTDVAAPPLNAGFGSGPNGGIPSVFANVLYTPRNVDLANMPYENPVDRSSVYYRGGDDITNPIWVTKYYSNTSVVNRFFNSTSLNYDINKNFGLVYRVGLDTYTENQEVLLNKGGGAGVSTVVNSGVFQSTTIKNTIWNHDVNLNYNASLGEKLNLTALLGGNYRADDYEQFGLASTNQLTFGLFNHANFINTSSRNPFSGGRINGIEQQRRAGVYSSVTLDYGDFLFVNVLARNDWTSTVEADNRRILYPGASISFIPTSAFEGMESNTLRYLKFRLGYGTSAGFPNPYGTRNILVQNPRGWADAAGNLSSTQTISTTLGNPNLKPELQQELEFGTEAVMFNNRFRFELSLYERNTKDLITAAPLDPSTGFTFTNINIGSLRTRGLELNATITPIKTRSGLNWDITANYGMYRSIIQELTAGLEEVVFSGFTNLGNFAIAGKPYGIIKGIGIERDANGNKIVLPNGRYKESSDIRELGDPNPAFTSSLINSFSFKGFNLSFMFEYRHKGVIVSNTVKGVLARGLSRDTDQLDRDQTLILPGVQEDGRPNDVQVTASNYFFDNYFFSDEAITFDGSTFRLREASLSYNLPTKVIGKTPFKAASLTITGSNLWFRALNMPKFVNFDTDVLSTGVGNGLGFDYLTGPSARRYGATLNLTF